MRLSISFSSLVVLLCFGAQLATATPYAMHLAMTPNPDELVFSWQTKAQTATSQVCIGSSPSSLKCGDGARSFQGSYDSDAGYNHHVLIQGLSAGSMVFYSVGDAKDGFSPVFNTTTRAASLPAQGWRAALYGDLGVDHSSATIAALNALGINRTIEFVLHVGDLSYANDHPLHYEDTWNDWFSSLEPLMVRYCPGLGFACREGNGKSEQGETEKGLSNERQVTSRVIRREKEDKLFREKDGERMRSFQEGERSFQERVVVSREIHNERRGHVLIQCRPMFRT